MKMIDYVSPKNETSLFKGIPILEYTKETRNYIRSLAKPGAELRFLFRGPRPPKYGRSPHTRQSYCIKEDAKTFAVYIR